MHVDHLADLAHARKCLALATAERCTVAKLLWAQRLRRLNGRDDDEVLMVDPGPRLVASPTTVVA